MALFRNPTPGTSRNGGSRDTETLIVERETEESLTSALHDSDSPAELLQDAGDDSRRSIPRTMLAVVGLLVTVSSVLAMRRLRARRQSRNVLERGRRLLRRH